MDFIQSRKAKQRHEAFASAGTRCVRVLYLEMERRRFLRACCHHLDTGRCDDYRVLELCAALAVAGDGGPIVGPRLVL